MDVRSHETTKEKALTARHGDDEQNSTGGHLADFFTTAVRTGGEGIFGLSVLLIPRSASGISIRKMETMHGTRARSSSSGNTQRGR